MNIARRTKRVAGVTGLLAALALTASGCSAPAESNVPSGAETATSAPASEAPVETKPAVVETPNKVATFDIKKTIIDPSYVDAFGYEQSEIDAISRDGVKIASVMYAEHLDWTLKGFQRTEEHWNIISTELRPLINDSAFAFIQKEYAEKQKIPALAANQTDAGEPKTYTTPSGKSCTDSPTTPYDVELTKVELSAANSIGNVMAPVLKEQFTVTITCEQGYQMRGVLGVSFVMEKSGDKYLMAHGYSAAALQKFEVI